MKKTRGIGILLVLCLTFVASVLIFQKNTGEVSAAALPGDYYFLFGSQKKTDGSEYELKKSEAIFSVTPGVWDGTATVDWISSEVGVVTVEKQTGLGGNFAKLVRQGPGYSEITAVIKEGTSSFSVSFNVKVDLEVNAQKTGLTTVAGTNEKILVLDKGQSQQVYLKYVDYTDDAGTVSGDAITVAVQWESDKTGVVTVDENGKVTAAGGGSAKLNITTNTFSSKDKSLSIPLTVVVKPKFSLSYDDIQGDHKDVDSVDDITQGAAPAKGVPSAFVLKSDAAVAQNLVWKVYDYSTKAIINPAGSSKLTYTVSTVGGNVLFENVKAGTYEIYAFTDKSYGADSNVPYAYMKVEVPIQINDASLFMTVNDIYSIVDNSNIPSYDIFNYSIIGDSDIIELSSGVITAKKQGTVTVRMEYIPGMNLFDGSNGISKFDITINVIDGLALSMTSATIYTNGTLQLYPKTTNNTKVTWSSSNTKVATVTDGLVKGVSKGSATIYAKQTINGIVKTAKCEIKVEPSVDTITIDPSTATLKIDGYLTLHAQITPKDLEDATLQWRSSDESVVKIVETFPRTATIQGVAGGTAVISAINQDNVVVGYCHVTVLQPVKSITLSDTNITVSQNISSIQLRAIVSPDNAANKAIRWSSTDTSKATVDQNGKVTIKSSGNVTIIAVSVDNPDATALCNIDIKIPVTSVSLDTKTRTMYVGQSDRLTYVVLPTTASNNQVTWTSSNTSVVAVDGTGKVTAKGVGSAVIILRTVDGGYTAFCTITVKSIATGIKFDVSQLAMKTGETYTLKVTLTPKDSTENDLVWESSDTKVVTVDDNGKLVAKGSGAAVVMARTEAGAAAYCKISVNQAVDGLILNFSEKTIYIGDTFKLKVAVTPGNASDRAVTWKSSNTKVATIAADGTINALTGGTTIITCTTADGEFSATCILTVREQVTKIKLNHTSYKLGLNKSVQMEATIVTDSTTDKGVTWSSSNENVAVVNSKGKVTGIDLGYATITATAKDGSEVEASCSFRVVNPVSEISLNDSYINMLVGQSKTLKATILPKKATYKTAKWTSSDESIAIVDDGKVTALKAGTVTITAAAQDSSGKKAVCSVTVRERVPSTGVTVQDKKLVMVPGEYRTVQKVMTPADSTDFVTWSTDNTSVVKVNKSSGGITAVSTGTANITVMTSSGKTAAIEVTVVGLNYSKLTLEQYTSFNLNVQGATSGITWQSANPEVAVIDRNGNGSTRAVGTTVVTAKVNGRTLSCKVTVTKIKH